MRPLACAFAFVCLLATGCSLPSSSVAATSARTNTTPTGSPLAPANSTMDAEVAMPAGFPSDFPIYPHARLTAAAPFASSGQVAWGMEWQTTDAQAKVSAFYTKQLSSGDWVLGPTASPNGDFAASFTRKSDKSFQGTVYADWNATATRILVSLVYPA
jgi:hypothetical protein